jgi:hypothetical protein
MSYANEKLGIAIYELTVGEGDIKERLESITKYLAPLAEKDFPEHLRGKWRFIMGKLTAKESNVKGTTYDEGSFSASMFRMHKSTTAKIVKELLELNEGLEAAEQDGIW